MMRYPMREDMKCDCVPLKSLLTGLKVIQTRESSRLNELYILHMLRLQFWTTFERS